MSQVLLFNPRAQRYKARIPNSILQVGASIEGLYDYTLVDGNLEEDPWPKIEKLLSSGSYRYFGLSVMPGPQLRQAIPYSKQVKTRFPHIGIIWGGYFPSNQPGVVLNSGFVDFVVNGMGDKCFPQLIKTLETGEDLSTVSNLIYLREGKLVKNPKDAIYEPDHLPQ